ncbi:transporter [Caldimonas brevitalea]|uniref:Transporter n=2 Tax=Caldimonas brevitalea TaxID=413882 RepID=A0A0G3BS66_9BURK|nr:transporter [Caldimonas brevitalea]
MFPVMTSALTKLDPFNFTALRYTLAGLGFIILLLLMEGSKSLSLKGERTILVWFLGTCGFAGFGFLVFYGQELAGPSGALTASITMATMPMLGMLVNWIVRRTRPPLPTLLLILLSFAGVSLVITEGNFSDLVMTPEAFVPNIPILAGALCWVIYTVGGSFFPTWSAYRYTALTTVMGLTTVYAVVAVLTVLGKIHIPSVAQVFSVGPHLLYMALVAGLVAVLCWNVGNKILTPLNGVLFMDVVPITAFTLSALTGVQPGSMQVAGACITAFALIANNIYQRMQAAGASRKNQMVGLTAKRAA